MSRYYLTAHEIGILEKVKPHISVVEEMYKPNLAREKNCIIGVRSEDLFFILQAITIGQFPIGGNGVRNKGQGFFLTPNPEHSYCKTLQKNNPETLRLLPTYQEAIRKNLMLYGGIAIIAPFNREIRPHIQDEMILVKGEDEYDNGEPAESLVETFYHRMARDLGSIPGVCNVKDYTNRLPRLKIILDSPGLVRDSTADFLDGIKRRKPVLIGFNEKLNQYARAEPGEGEVDIVYQIEADTIPLDTLVGFEVVGDVEEQIVGDLLEFE